MKISSRRGSISARAYLTEGEAPGQLWMERFWNPKCFDDSQKNKTGGWRECNINILANNFIDHEGDENPYNDMFGSYTLRGFTVKIEKGETGERLGRTGGIRTVYAHFASRAADGRCILMAKALGIDLNRCTGCDTCQVACKMENKIGLSMSWNRVIAMGPSGARRRLHLLFRRYPHDR